MPKIIKVEPPVQTIRPKRRVAAYARVSMETENLLHSLSAQVSAYSTLIQNNPEWIYAGVYVDEGVTGTSTKKREEFNRMMEDCETGKIDLILVKSISRFARNTVDTLTAVRHLKDIGVEVRFERENISTFSGDGELLLTILASFAQAESESISHNVKWSVKKRFEQGIPNTSLRSFGYDWDAENKSLVINPEEAKWVRYIYEQYLEGASIKGLAKDLREKGITALRGETLSRTTIRRILTSRMYTGDIILQQYYTEGVHRVKRNMGEVQYYEVEENHDPIVTKEEFAAVQERIARRAKKADNYGYKKTTFAGMVKCGKCGYSCSHVKYSHNLVENAYLECNRRKTGECDLLPIKEADLIRIVEKEFGAMDGLERITIFDDRIDFRLGDGKVRTHIREFPNGGRMATCFSRRSICGECGATAVRTLSGTRKCWICSAKKSDKKVCSNRMLTETEFREAGQWAVGAGENFEMRYYCEVENAVIYMDRIIFKMRNGGEKVWERK